MPYIKQDDRPWFDAAVEAFDNALYEAQAIGEPGPLNYLITQLLQRYLEVQVREADGLDAPNYAMFNEVIGVLECSKLEFYARKVRAYEDGKIRQNGDVYQ